MDNEFENGFGTPVPEEPQAEIIQEAEQTAAAEPQAEQTAKPDTTYHYTQPQITQTPPAAPEPPAYTPPQPQAQSYYNPVQPQAAPVYTAAPNAAPLKRV
jgi:hypothetical protein